MYHINDAIGVDMWVKKVSGPDSPAIYYKPQGESSEDIPLEKDDFLLVLMNSAQSEILQKFGNNIVCMDSTHGTNGYNFLLSTILVIDDKCEGFPVCFIILNKQDHVIFQYALTKIKECGLNIEAKVFMSDIDYLFYNTWIETFKTPEFRLWCIWHVDQAWKKNKFFN
ncbi:MULE domain-containing protein [Trichonephila clavipes]|nr:MULE domain-containing protein [Trichonephila clavipes]